VIAGKIIDWLSANVPVEQNDTPGQQNASNS